MGNFDANIFKQSIAGKFVPGVYTLAVSEALPEEMQVCIFPLIEASELLLCWWSYCTLVIIESASGTRFDETPFANTSIII